ncbi:protein of unknown function [Tenacibaculum sp. 190130A14a]|uniref:Riboflavin synthase subunit beta n=1 Tax=Tenacibaculum polynesiense TaxID=3137857 RepID=A0ABM9P7W9_9FLAO
MARHNPNTQYGRRKNREEAFNRYRNLKGKEKEEYDKIYNTIYIIFFVLVVIIGFVVISMGGELK